MRLIFGIVCVLVGLGMFACGLEGIAQEAAQPRAIEWVRTVDGWERPDGWQLSAGTCSTPPPLHPLVVAAGQVLLSLFGLAACQREC